MTYTKDFRGLELVDYYGDSFHRSLPSARHHKVHAPPYFSRLLRIIIMRDGACWLKTLQSPYSLSLSYVPFNTGKSQRAHLFQNGLYPAPTRTSTIKKKKSPPKPFELIKKVTRTLQGPGKRLTFRTPLRTF